MRSNLMLATVFSALAALTVLPGCAVTRDQSSVGEYIDDATVTASVKARFVESKAVDASAISVETLNGEVMLSGFAKSATEKSEAERIARDVKGARAVKNAIQVRAKQD
jgi:osmotically-inducible protein OsmY